MPLNIAFIGNSEKFSSHYGRVYHRIGTLIGNKACIRRFVDPGAVIEDPSGPYLNAQMSEMRSFGPDIVFHNPVDLASQIATEGKTMGRSPEEIHGAYKMVENAFARDFYGSVELLSEPLEIETSTKDGFYKLCKQNRIPTPRTVVIRDIDPALRTHAHIARMLGRHDTAEIVYKNCRGGCGLENFLVSSHKEMRKVFGSGNGSNFVAQERVNIGPIPFSMRVVTFGTSVIGGVLLVNPEGGFSSNGAQGGTGLGLALYGERFIECGLPDIGLDSREILRIFGQAGVDPFERKIPDEVLRLASIIGGLPSRNLLRGIDFLFDIKRNVYALECNSVPGPPGERMWADMTGTSAPSGHKALMDLEVDIAAKLIAGVIKESRG